MRVHGTFHGIFRYFGRRFSEHGLRLTDRKVKAIKMAPTPRNVTELRSFLRLLAALTNFMPKLSTPTHPLYELVGTIPLTGQMKQYSTHPVLHSILHFLFNFQCVVLYSTDYLIFNYSNIQLFLYHSAIYPNIQLFIQSIILEPPIHPTN